MLKVSTDKLLIMAGIVWFVAGLNVMHIGLIAYQQDWGVLIWPLVGGTLVVFGLFHFLIFTKMVDRHAERIRSYEEDRTSLFKFFDKKGYIMMSAMMGVGVALRLSGFAPDWLFAFFYTGLGAALVVAGICFVVHYVRNMKSACAVLPNARAEHDQR